MMVRVGQEGQVDRDGQGRSGCPKISRACTYPSQGYMYITRAGNTWLITPAELSWHNPDPKTTMGDSLGYP